jgi:large subunit ribosomal protein L18
MGSKKQEKRAKRQRRIRAKISGTLKRPRLALFRSNKHVYAQLLDDTKHITLVSLSDKGLKDAKKFGESLAKIAQQAKITKVVFDRRGYAYHGIIKAIAEAARLGGLEF